jgi:hypothetical protein
MRDTELVGQRLHRVRLTLQQGIDDFHRNQHFSNRAVTTGIMHALQHRDHGLAHAIGIEATLGQGAPLLLNAMYRILP